jgi:hypothetical protein
MEWSLFWATGTTGDGTDPYTQSQLFTWLRAIVGVSGGVLAGYLEELEPTLGTGAVIINTGGAYVYGIPYFNSGDVQVEIPAPVTALRIDRIVLRANWSARTVRVTRLVGAEGGNQPPALTQEPDNIYEIALAQVKAYPNGVLELTDERTFLHFHTQVSSEMFDDDAIAYIDTIKNDAITTSYNNTLLLLLMLT